MATEIIKGALEDHQGRIMYPDTEADQVMLPNGVTVDKMVEQILARFASYLPMTGGTVSGPLGVDKTITVNQWGGISAGTDGNVVIGENCYKHPTNNTFHFSRTHGSMGARGIVFQNGQPGIWYFDTGSRATTADEQFTPTLISLTDKSTKDINGDMNNITENGLYNGTSLANAPSEGWYWVNVFNHNIDPTKWVSQIAYDFNSTKIYRRSCVYGTWTPWDMILTQSNAPSHYYYTREPLATDGKDGDVWDVYV
jgi:hypothetical protein